MIRILLIKLLDEKSFQEKRRITLSEVSEKTGISRATLTKLMTQMGLPVPPHQHIQSMLQASKALCSTRYRETSGYAIPLDQWSLYYSLRGSR